MIFLWSSNFVVAKYALREIPPLLLGALRFTVAGLVILPWFVWRRMQASDPLKLKGDVLKLLLLGICGVGALMGGSTSCGSGRPDRARGPA